MIEPDEWFLCFLGTERHHWFDRFTKKGFRHVCAFAYLPLTGCWVFYDVNIFRTVISVSGGEDADRRIGGLARLGKILRVKPGAGGRWWSRLGFWCVPAMKHLIGSRSSALTPYGLYRDLLEQGSEPAFEESYEFWRGRSAGRSGSCPPASAGTAEG